MGTCRRPARLRELPLITLQLEALEALEVDGFGHRNVLEELIVQELQLAAWRQLQVSPPSTKRLAGDVSMSDGHCLRAAP
jgi:hypothetical protein